MIIAGEAQTSTVVETRIEGEGQIYTYIESEVNGEKQVLEASEAGEYRLEMGTPGIKEEEVNQNEEKIDNEPGEERKIEEPVKETKTLVNQIGQILKNIWLKISRLFY